MKRTIRAVKAELRSKLPTQGKARLKRASSELQDIPSIVKDVPGNTGLPGLQAGITGLIFVLEAVQKTSQNSQDIEQLGKRIDELTTRLQKAKDRGALSETILSQIDRLSAKWTSVSVEVRKMSSRNTFERVVHYSDDVRSISDHMKTIIRSMESFNTDLVLAIEFMPDEQSNVVRRTEGKSDNVAQRPHEKIDAKDDHLPHAVFARFDCKVRAQCLKGTMTGILEQVDEWIGAGNYTTLGATESVSQNLPILWINGSAGTGKTTIASTVADTCSKHGILGASFFCSRDDAECSNPKLIFPTIAYQLGLFYPPFKAEVTLALTANPDIGYSGASYQLEELIVIPLRAVRKSFPACVIILDALDECKDSGLISDILFSLSRHVGDLSPLKILVTSRPEPNITLSFSNHLNHATQRLVLHEAELGVVQNDIEHYLRTNLARVRDCYGLDPSWPSPADIHALARLSVGLFIFASASVEFIEDQTYSNPKRQLAELLRTAKTVNNSSSPYHHLDQLYMDVLTRAFPNLSPALASQLKMVLGTIVLLRDPLSPVALERLLNLREGTVRETLANLRSVVIVPDDDNQVIRLRHPSFTDFMTSPARCTDPKLVVDVGIQHTLLARECLNVLKDLRRNICDIKNPSMLNNEVDDLRTRIETYIPPQLQYACRYWVFHLTNGMISDVLVDLLNEFCSKYLLYWVEACSLLGELRGALLALDSAQRELANVVENLTVTTLLHDCERFTREFFSVISASSLQVYDSALLLTPVETSIYKAYAQELVFPMKIHNASQTSWDVCMRTMDGHCSNVRSVTFSPDGTHIASGSDDKTVRLWDAVSGAHLSTLRGHSGDVFSVAFSPDGTRVVSGSHDKTLRLWDPVSGTHLNTLEGHSGPIFSVTFSPDGRRVVSGSDDKSLRLWDPVSGVHLSTLKGHSGSVLSVTFSPDGTRFVSGSNDKTVRLWDTVTGTHLNTFKGHSGSVLSVTFSPDGKRFVSGSNDKTVRLWDAVTGTHLNTLKGHSSDVNSAAFSPDSTRVISGSNDKTVRLWDAETGTHLKTLKGHSSDVNSVAFSPDGTRAISGSHDNTIRLWDVDSVIYTETLEGHSGSVFSVAFSPDGTRVVSGSYDKTVRLWDATSGKLLNTLRGHSNYILSVAFSPDGTRIVSGSTDDTFRLWDADSGVYLDTIEGSWDSATSAANSLQSSTSQSRPVAAVAKATSNYFIQDGWVCSLPQKRRLCWIPVSCRPVEFGCIARSGHRVALGTQDGRVVILDFTDMDSYLLDAPL